MNQLTPGEERIMQILWQTGQGFVKDILAFYDEPRPAYTTLATLLTILEKKGFVGHRSYGKAYQYYPLVSKNQYSKKYLNPVFRKYFKGNIKDIISFFSESNKLSQDDIEEAIKMLKSMRKKKH
jgi:BlaI family transcriptional regulator, penicillinase repressor